MAEVFLISDTHLGHKNILKFTKPNGELLRPGFVDVDDMNRYIFAAWRKVVTDKDKIYHLGDVAFNKYILERMVDLPGKKRLVRGNHDLFKLKTYARVFEDVYGVKQINGMWLTHFPMHPAAVEQPRVKANIHGHLHAHHIMFKPNVRHPKYENVCVENLLGYAPVPLDELVEIIKQRNS
ncbi:MAG TPA: metallophosphoesterase family protein [Mariprofundaceae bacterium]|nr:metallophosphoesterase family protein [Mariprofundaceae bacterium]